MKLPSNDAEQCALNVGLARVLCFATTAAANVALWPDPAAMGVRLSVSGRRKRLSAVRIPNRTYRPEGDARLVLRWGLRQRHKPI